MWWDWKQSRKVWSHLPTDGDVVSRKTKSKSVISFANRMWCGETENKVEKCDLICPQNVTWWVGKPSRTVGSHLPTEFEVVSRKTKSKSVILFAHRTWCGESENQVEKCDLHLPTERDVMSRNPKSKSVISFAHRIWCGESENQVEKYDIICPQTVMWWVGKQSLKVWSHLPTGRDMVSRNPKSKSVISFAHRMWCGETENKVEKYDLICPQTVMWWVGKQSLKAWSHLPTECDVVRLKTKSKSVISFAHKMRCGESENKVENVISYALRMWCGESNNQV